MFAIFATLRIDVEHVEKFREASFGDSQGSVRDEPDCFRFDILQNSAEKNLFHLYEVYEDTAAFEAHQTTPHFKEWFARVQPWLEGKPEVVTMNTVFPSDQGWRKQKPSLLQW